jgi:hypothetical protein
LDTHGFELHKGVTSLRCTQERVLVQLLSKSDMSTSQHREVTRCKTNT